MEGLIAIFAIIVGYYLWRRRRSARAQDTAWMPPALRDASLAYSEHEFTTTGDIHLTARVDRAYRRRDGVLILVEFKRRSRATVYETDKVELSAQRYAIEHSSGHQVSQDAFVVPIHPNGVRLPAIPVTLESHEQVEARVARQLAVRRGEVAARYARFASVCEKCGHRRRCKGAGAHA